MIYLDNSATTRPFDEVAEAVNICLRENYFNPSSAYTPAVELERKLEHYRTLLAQAMGVSPGEVIYTSGATESNNLAILGTQNVKRAKGQLITTKVEHPSVYEVFRSMQERGYEVTYLDVDNTGKVRLDQLEQALNASVSLVSIMQVNNETGAINDINHAYALIRRRAPQAIFHVDGVQAFCKMPFARLSCDAYSISGHKFHAMKGVGALYIRSGVPFGGGFIGGGQENGLRSGTTNAPGIIAMGEALNKYRRNQAAYVERMRQCKYKLAANLKQIGDVVFNGPSLEEGAPHILNASFLGVRGETLLNALSQRNIIVSTGSACSAHKKGKNRVLCAMGTDEAAQESAIRFSFSPENTVQEMDAAAQTIQETVAQLRQYKKR